MTAGPNVRRLDSDTAPLPESAGRRDEHTDLSQMTPMLAAAKPAFVLLVATHKIGMPECARLVKPARAVEAAVSGDERHKAATTRMKMIRSLRSLSV